MKPLTHVQRRTCDWMRDTGLTVLCRRETAKGRLRYAMSDGGFITSQTVKALLKRGLLERTPIAEEFTLPGVVRYQLTKENSP